MLRFVSLGLVALTAVSCGEEIPFTPPKPQRVILVGVDGATWTVIGPLIEKGELPAFKRMIAEGAHMPKFDTLRTTQSPAVWTTVATGRSPEDHGITHFVEKLPNGKVIPVTQYARKTKALWNLAGENGLTVGVVDWWASWPAEEVAGYVVTNHANPVNIRYREHDKANWTVDSEKLRELHRDYYPAELGATLDRFWLKEDEFPSQEFMRRGKFTAEQTELVEQAAWYSREPYSVLKRSPTRDFSNFKFAMHMMEAQPTDLLMLYIRGPDDLQHMAWDLVEPEKYWRKNEHFERDRGIVEGIYHYIDSFLGELLDAKDEATIVILASDHGATAEPRAKVKGWKGLPGTHPPRCRGVLFMHGGSVKAGHVIQDADPRDLMPTVAWLLGIPLSLELEGDVLTDAFEDEFVRKQGIRTVAAYGPREVTGVAEESPQDAAMIENLKVLGYVK